MPRLDVLRKRVNCYTSSRTRKHTGAYGSNSHSGRESVKYRGHEQVTARLQRKARCERCYGSARTPGGNGCKGPAWQEGQDGPHRIAGTPRQNGRCREKGNARSYRPTVPQSRFGSLRRAVYRRLPSTRHSVAAYCANPAATRSYFSEARKQLGRDGPYLRRCGRHTSKSVQRRAQSRVFTERIHDRFSDDNKFVKHQEIERRIRHGGV